MIGRDAISRYESATASEEIAACASAVQRPAPNMNARQGSTMIEAGRES